jgi:hypothetical protein
LLILSLLPQSSIGEAQGHMARGKCKVRMRRDGLASAIYRYPAR